MQGMTDRLIGVVEASRTDFVQAKVLLAEAVALQVQAVSELLQDSPRAIDRVVADICADAVFIETLLRQPTPNAAEQVAGLGEVWSARTMGAYLESRDANSAVLDAREVLLVQPSKSGLGAKGSACDTSVDPLYDDTVARLQQWWMKRPQLAHRKTAPILVVTGFVASNPCGAFTTLKRSGSDLSATIFGKLLHASRVTLWKNVDGVLSADPRVVADAQPVPRLSFAEARELAYFGSQVLHPAAMTPLVEENLPLYVRNVFNPDSTGTKITRQPSATSPMKAVSAIQSVSMIRVQGKGWGSVARILGLSMLALEDAGVAVVLVTQNSAEHSVAVAVDEASAPAGVAALHGALQAHNADVAVTAERGLSLVTVVGDSSHRCPAAQLLTAVADVAPVYAVAQGSSSLSSSVVVQRDHLQAAIRAVHTAFSTSC
mmetsp:Transcript_34828/g.90964  ORF Transcript_34828/g.90964 Transcript_34828/m.90964 type:complete len:431 (-) Transcript_34828:390-1682(-)